MNGLTEPTEQGKLINKREYYKIYYENKRKQLHKIKKLRNKIKRRTHPIIRSSKKTTKRRRRDNRH
jgi:hypothetical protein